METLKYWYQATIHQNCSNIHGYKKVIPIILILLIRHRKPGIWFLIPTLFQTEVMNI